MWLVKYFDTNCFWVGFCVLTSRKVFTVVPFVPIIAPACEDWTRIRSSVSPSFRRIPDFIISSFKISAIFFINKSNFSRLKYKMNHDLIQSRTWFRFGVGRFDDKIMVWLPCYANFEDSFWCTCFWNINNGSKLNYTLLIGVSCEIEKIISSYFIQIFRINIWYFWNDLPHRAGI